MKNRCAIVTGASGGIGRELTRQLAAQGYRVIMACRNTAKGEQVRVALGLTDGQAEVRELDLASFASIGRFSDALPPVDLLMNNAGAMSPCEARTAEGIEMNVGVNYFGTWLLTQRVMPHLTENARIVNTVSCTVKVGKMNASFLDECCAPWPEGKTYRRLETYSDSKLAVALFTAELAKRLQGTSVTVAAADPGVVDTNMITMQRWFDPLADLFFRPFIKSPARGALSALRAAADNRNGYLFLEKRCRPLPDYPGCEELWDRTEVIVREKLQNKSSSF